MSSPAGGSTASRTANWIAAARAKETEGPGALFLDPYAAMLAGDVGRAALAASERASGGPNEFLPLRTRFFDDVILAEVRAGDQVVLLGAGLDTRAFRLPLPDGVDWFEVDDAAVLEGKMAALRAVGAATRCRMHRLVGADFELEWADGLREAGYVAGRRTLWVAEGVLFYLSEGAATALVSAAARFSGTESVFVADVSGTGLYRLPAMQPYLESLARRGLPPPFATDEPVGLLRRAGWDRVEIAEPSGLAQRYGRSITPAAPVADVPAGSMRTHLVVARRSAST